MLARVSISSFLLVDFLWADNMCIVKLNLNLLENMVLKTNGILFMRKQLELL